MKLLLQTVSFAGLAAMFGAAIAVFNGALSRDAYYLWALGGTAAWFGTVPFWMKRRLQRST
ncbi:MAG TPA: hypothetical protein VHC86_15865 [Opitutaceae bacterium]|nr:hypothetical protein [Opitutaceae bacterium]